jgi:hypothetical protein
VIARVRRGQTGPAVRGSPPDVAAERRGRPLEYLKPGFGSDRPCSDGAAG